MCDLLFPIICIHYASYHMYILLSDCSLIYTFNSFFKIMYYLFYIKICTDQSLYTVYSLNINSITLLFLLKYVQNTPHHYLNISLILPKNVKSIISTIIYPLILFYYNKLNLLSIVIFQPYSLYYNMYNVVSAIL